MKLLPRLLILLLLLVVIQAVHAMVRSGTPYSVRPPATNLDEMPLKLGDWTCSEPSQRDADAKDRSGADVSVHRIYGNADARVAISAYVAIWTRYEGGYLPHEPTMCYEGSGHTILDTSEVQLQRGGQPIAKARLMHVERDEQSAYVLYWYQLNQDTMYDIQQMHKIRWTYLGEPSWPPLVKVMLDIRGTDEATARRLLTDLGQQILAWTSQKL
jgi:EpsI family protein